MDGALQRADFLKMSLTCLRGKGDQSDCRAAREEGGRVRGSWRKDVEVQAGSPAPA